VARSVAQHVACTVGEVLLSAEVAQRIDRLERMLADKPVMFHVSADLTITPPAHRS